MTTTKTPTGWLTTCPHGCGWEQHHNTLRAADNATHHHTRTHQKDKP